MTHIVTRTIKTIAASRTSETNELNMVLPLKTRTTSNKIPVQDLLSLPFHENPTSQDVKAWLVSYLKMHSRLGSEFIGNSLSAHS